jgi:hypothetical protein
LVNVGRAVKLAAKATSVSPAHVVDQDEDDVRVLTRYVRSKRGRQKKAGDSAEGQPQFHILSHRTLGNLNSLTATSNGTF